MPPAGAPAIPLLLLLLCVPLGGGVWRTAAVPRLPCAVKPVVIYNLFAVFIICNLTIVYSIPKALCCDPGGDLVGDEDGSHDGVEAGQEAGAQAGPRGGQVLRLAASAAPLLG